MQVYGKYLRMAGSIMSGLFVAPMMKTFFFDPMPSISVRIWLMTRSAAPPASPTEPPRALAIESSSSKNNTQGAADLENEKKDMTNHFIKSRLISKINSEAK